MDISLNNYQLEFLKSLPKWANSLSNHEWMLQEQLKEDFLVILLSKDGEALIAANTATQKFLATISKIESS